MTDFLPIPSVKLSSGSTMPIFGLGTWQSLEGRAGMAVEEALKIGYRHVDCAQAYRNEPEIGNALDECFKTGICKREEVFITSKLWSKDQFPEYVEEACRLSLKNLRVDYLDLYLVHIPHAIKHDAVTVKGKPLTEDQVVPWCEERLAAVWKKMELMVEMGLVRSIGISNFSIKKTESLLKTAKIPPAVNQVESHPYLQQPNLKRFCDSNSIIFEAYSPLGSPERPYKESDDPIVLEDPVLLEIAKKHNASPAQICIAYQIARGAVVIAKSVTDTRIKENLLASQVQMSADDIESIAQLDRGARLITAAFIRPNESSDSFWDTTYDNNYYN